MRFECAAYDVAVGTAAGVNHDAEGVLAVPTEGAQVERGVLKRDPIGSYLPAIEIDDYFVPSVAIVVATYNVPVYTRTSLVMVRSTI